MVIRGNALHTGDGSTQSIFLGNSVAGMYWRNVTIEGNTVVAGHVHGIYVARANGLAIRGNTVVQDMTTGLNGQINMPRIDVTTDSSGVTITGNIAHAISTKAGWTVVNNQLVSKGYKIAGSLEDKAYASGAPAPAPTVPDVDDGTRRPGRRRHPDAGAHDSARPRSASRASPRRSPRPSTPSWRASSA